MVGNRELICSTCSGWRVSLAINDVEVMYVYQVQVQDFKRMCIIVHCVKVFNYNEN